MGKSGQRSGIRQPMVGSVRPTSIRTGSESEIAATYRTIQDAGLPAFRSRAGAGVIVGSRNIREGETRDADALIRQTVTLSTKRRAKGQAREAAKMLRRYIQQQESAKRRGLALDDAIAARVRLTRMRDEIGRNAYTNTGREEAK
jgi:hypothetical protein